MGSNFVCAILNSGVQMFHVLARRVGYTTYNIDIVCFWRQFYFKAVVGDHFLTKNRL